MPVLGELFRCFLEWRRFFLSRKNKHLYREYLYEPGEMFATRNGNLRIVERLRVVGKDGISRKKYRMECPVGHRYLVSEEYLKNGRLRTCKMCNHPVIAQVDPEFAKWFVDPSVPRRVPPFSKEKADFYCQQCGNVVRDLSVSNIYQRRRIACALCSDGVSYPERFVGAVLRQMGISFQRQYCVRYEKGGKGKRYLYDFFDEDRGLILETHGQQHFEMHCFDKMGGQGLEAVQKNDAEKEAFAREVLGCDYIWLDCRKSEPEWIRREIEKKLTFYPLERVDWKAAQQETHTSLTLRIVALYNEGVPLADIAKQVQLYKTTVCTKLRRAKKAGFEVKEFSRPKPAPRPRPKKTRPAVRVRPQPHLRKKPINPRQELLDALWLPSETEGVPISREQQLTILRESGRAFATLDKYRTSVAYVRFLCAQCGQVFRRAPRDFFKDPSCKCCTGTEIFRKKLWEKYGDEYEVRSPYSGSQKCMRFFHRRCGTEFLRSAHYVLRRGCPICNRENRLRRTAQTKQKKGYAKFQKVISEIEQMGYRFEGEEFRGLGRTYPFRCPHCGEIWMTEPYHILSGRNHICISPTKKKTHEAFLAQVHQLEGNAYSVLTEYRNALTEVQMKHNVCGRTYLVRPAEFTSSGKRCPYCWQQGRKSGKPPDQIRENLDFYEAIHTQQGKETRKLLERVWERKLQDAKDYREKYGNLDIPDGYIVNGYDLGSWLADQKKAQHKGRLAPMRAAKLSELGIRWAVKEENWQQRYAAYRAFLETHGGSRPANSADKEERSLFYWFNDQQELYRQGRLSAERAGKLEKLGARLESASDAHFEEMYQKLRRFREEHGHCIVPIEEGRGEPQPLGLWAQRLRSKLKAGELSQPRVEALLALGFPRDNKEAKFYQKLTLLTAYYEANGHLRIPQSYTENGAPLGKMINVFRVQYSKGQLAEYQIAELEKLGMVWKAK